ncbi:MAG: hypothetical protein OEW89_08400 [Gammaproteobacteria bacterium]|nr:hypothetical protein [Gammaproteobacteria bacterium]MDH5593321.1 hypothetical protein [Gammaproteobacteria bacterium]
MRKRTAIVGFFIIYALLQGCAGFGIVATSDPRIKLSDARHLFSVQTRPLPAERLIREAIVICEQNSDQDCLAEAYLTYGYFFRSDSIEYWEKVYRRDGFLDRTVSFDDRFKKSIEYFEKAILLTEKSNNYGKQTNAYLNLGAENERMGRKIEACENYAKSLVANKKNIKANPKAKVVVPDGYSNYAEFLAEQQKRAGCID